MSTTNIPSKPAMAPVSKLNTDAWSADNYNAIASFVYSKEFTTPVLSLLNAQPGECILDLGCGSGELTLELAKIVGESGVVLGIDSSANMIEKARKHGVTACIVGDAQALELPPPSNIREEISRALPASFDYKFDAIFTNAALHWCKRSPGGVAEGAARALRKGGPLRRRNGRIYQLRLRMAIHTVMRGWGYDPVQLDPWYFPSIEDYTQVLENAGFRVSHIALVPRLTPLKTDIVDWQRTFCRNTFFSVLSDSDAEDVMREVQELCTVDCKDASGRWALMYTRLRFVAVLE
ncbi:hypothetical protein EW145_g502 [Phellinidium pouzarii]|uniref:Methyltransferase domain-containing protein n=1 Tax=Phellinidium pouzarii TaxID=167371 RepID=A0A4S4LI05_9AGAM|nr:hypothetical protein EW145_g502 [Phellinidium pouzarii]